MKKNCPMCDKEVEVRDDFKFEFCCDGYMCACAGRPVNEIEILCNECYEKFFGETKDE